MAGIVGCKVLPCVVSVNACSAGGLILGKSERILVPLREGMKEFLRGMKV